MRRNKKASLPVNSVPPAVRRKAASARESTVAYPSSSSLGSSTSDTSWRCDDPLPLPERKAAPWRAEAARPLDFVHHTALNEHPEPPAQTAAPPPPPLPHHHPSSCSESGHRVRGLAFQADNMLNIFHSIPTQMDYKGQKLAEQIFQGIILFSAAVGFVYGYITEQFGWTVYIVMAGFALSCLLTLPPWPIYRRNPLKWLPAQESTTEDKKPTDRKVKRHPKN